MTKPINALDAYFLAAQKVTGQTEDATELAKAGVSVSKGLQEANEELKGYVEQLLRMNEELLQQRNWACSSLEELSASYDALEHEKDAHVTLYEVMSYAHGNHIKEAIASEVRNERHIKKLCNEIQHMQKKLNKRRLRINQLQNTIGVILKERPIITDYDKMNSVVLSEVVKSLTEKLATTKTKEKEERLAAERLFKIEISDVRRLVNRLQLAGYNDDAIREFIQTAKDVNNELRA